MATLPTLLFRCDANAETGLGHVARCRDLARLLRLAQPELRIVFAGDLSAYAQGTLAAHGFELVGMLAGEALVTEHLTQLAGAGARLLLDSYRLDEAALGVLPGWRAPWGVFDDFAQHAYTGAALVINTRVGARAEPYRAAHLAIGPEYLPATPELEQTRASRAAQSPDAPRNILVFIGGTDQYQVGPKLARAAADCFGAARVVCVQDAPLDGENARIVQRPLGAELAPLIADADLVLAGGGRLKYEALYCLAPCASLSQTTGQAEDTAELAARGLCLDLGECASFDPVRVSAQLQNLWRAPALQAMRAAQARAFPAGSGARLAGLVAAALALA